jgi:hypothetical protein
MKPHWENIVKTPEERKVFECLSDPNWDYRTIEGIKMDTGLAEEQIEAILTRYGDELVHKAAVQDKFGRDLYTLAGTQPAAATAAALKPKKKILPIVLSTVSFVIAMSIFKECQREQLARQQAERANTIVTVWMPTGPDGRLFPYWDVEILDKGNDYVRFRTRDGQVMEQHGSFRIETSKRSDY